MKHSLSKIKLIHNPNYAASGIKSYVYLLRKCMFSGLVFAPPATVLHPLHSVI